MADQAAKQRRAFRRMLLKLNLSCVEIDELSFVYEKDDLNKSTDTTQTKEIQLYTLLLRQQVIQCDNEGHIDELIESLSTISRPDLIPTVEEYRGKWLQKSQPTPNYRARGELALQANAISSSDQDKEQSALTGIRKSGDMLSRPLHCPHRKKRKREGALTETDLRKEELLSSEDEVPCEKPSEDDKKYMTMACGASKKSPDKHKVGAVLVDLDTNEVLGTGFNRMPKGCENRFAWSADENYLSSKYPYVFHAVKAAIKDAYENKKDIRGSVLYTTLFPANTDAQWIVDCGIKEMVFVDDKYKNKQFSIAARNVLRDNVHIRKLDRQYM